VHAKLTGLKAVDLLSPDQRAWDDAGLGPGDIVHVETPLNPSGETRDLARFAELAHKRGALLTVDATFGPPPLQDPFKWGADVVMHSGTKYIGGHSDMLCGVLCVRKDEWWQGLFNERLFLGSVLGSLEGWLGVRSLRTLELRVLRQSANATSLVLWLDACLKGAEGAVQEEVEVVQKVVASVQHASLQAKEQENAYLLKQMPNGYGPVFAISLKTMEMAKTLPSKLDFFHHATSLGGVESLIEWRRMTDNTVDERLLRLSIGIEAWEDLRRDLLQGLKAVADLH
jgi:cystathionine gamma-synthase